MDGRSGPVPHQVLNVAGNTETILIMNYSFLLKHWILTLAIGAMLISFVSPLLTGQKINLWGNFVFLLYLFFLSIPFSLPVVVIYFIAGYSVDSVQLSRPIRKTILNAVAVFGICLTFAVIEDSPVSKTAILYSIATITASLPIKIN